MTADLPFTNISCYLFAPLTDLKGLRERLIAVCKERGLKGTILLSTEGINLFIAGPRVLVDELVAVIRSIPGLAGLAPKYSESAHQPFNRMLVRIKKEIIAFGVEGIDPAKYFAEASSISFARSVKYGFGCLGTAATYRMAKLGLAKSALFPPELARK